MPDTFQLRDLSDDGLAALLRRRRDVLGPVPPRSLEEVVARLSRPMSLVCALRQLDLPTLQVAEASAALGAAADRVRLAELLGVAAELDGEAALERSLGRLGDFGLLDGPGRLCAALSEGWPYPLGTEGRAVAMLPYLPVSALRQALELHGRPGDGPKDRLVVRLTAVFHDPDELRRTIARAPAGVTEHLLRAADPDQPVPWVPAVPLGAAPDADPDAAWAIAALLVAYGDGRGLVCPTEVLLALRAGRWRAPFHRTAPSVVWEARSTERVEAECAAALTRPLRLATDLLAGAGSRPVALRKAGGVGVRELRRLERTLGCSPGELRMVLELVLTAGLLAGDETRLSPTSSYDDWLAGDPAAREVTLLQSWRRLFAMPLGQPEEAWHPGTTVGLQELRDALLTLLAAHPDRAAATSRQLDDLLRWQAPLLTGALLGRQSAPGLDDEFDEFDDELDDRDGWTPEHPLQGVDLGQELLRETEWLGLTGTGALSSLGRALAEGAVGAELAERVRAVLGATRATARLQSDLTAVVLGHPDAQLARRLDSLADREGNSTASTWRFSAASLRRAMDAGVTETDIRLSLDEIADGEIPQPLTYLVGDVARRHGTLTASGVASVLVSQDPALLREVVADRRLRRLHLRVLADTVASSTAGVTVLLTALRDAGYSPVETSADGELLLTRSPVHRSATTRLAVPDEEGQPDPHQAAAALLAAPDAATSPLVDVGESVMERRDVVEYYRRMHD